MKALIATTLLLTGCGTKLVIDHEPDTTGHRTYSVDPRLEALTEVYFAECDVRARGCEEYHLSIDVGDPGEGRAGLCTLTWESGNRLFQRIIISPDYVDNYGVLFHELEHCTRFQEHTVGHAPHIMRSYALSSEELAERSIYDWLDETLARDVRISK